LRRSQGGLRLTRKDIVGLSLRFIGQLARNKLGVGT
jgi:hypothetical protein